VSGFLINNKSRASMGVSAEYWSIKALVYTKVPLRNKCLAFFTPKTPVFGSNEAIIVTILISHT
jgi:hypothetical protein